MLITLNRPDSANALNTQMANDLIEVFEGLALDPNNTRAVVVTEAARVHFVLVETSKSATA